MKRFLAVFILCSSFSLIASERARRRAHDAFKQSKIWHQQARTTLKEEKQSNKDIFDQAEVPDVSPELDQQPKRSRFMQKQINSAIKRGQDAFTHGQFTEKLRRTSLNVTIPNEKPKDLQTWFKTIARCTWEEKECPCPGIDGVIDCEKQGCISNLCDPDELTEKFVAILQGPDNTWEQRRCQAMHYVCSGNVDVNAMVKKAPPVVVGILHNDLPFIRFLLDHGADPNKRCRIMISEKDRGSAQATFNNWPGMDIIQGSAPLHWAVMHKRKPAIIPLLLEYGASLCPEDNANFSPLQDLAFHCSSYNSNGKDIRKKAQLLIDGGVSKQDIRATIHKRLESDWSRYSGSGCATLTSFLKEQLAHIEYQSNSL